MDMSSRNASDGLVTDQTEGRWVTPPVSYVEPVRRFCALCGRPIARRYFEAAPNGGPLAFCQPEHAELYRTYRPAEGSGGS